MTKPKAAPKPHPKADEPNEVRVLASRWDPIEEPDDEEVSDDAGDPD